MAGLCAAWWLAKSGWRVTVVERAPDLRANGYMLGLSGPGHEVARRMGLLPQLEARGRHIAENVYRGRDGREILRLRYRDFLSGLAWITLIRTDLVAVLYEAARQVAEIRFGVTLGDFQSDALGVSATLTDGTALRADLLIGADGIHSAVRAAVFGEEAQFARPFGYRVAAFQAPDTLHLGADFLSYAEPGRLAEVYTLSEERIATLYIWRTPDRGAVAPPHARPCCARPSPAPIPMRCAGSMRANPTTIFSSTMSNSSICRRGRRAASCSWVIPRTV